MSIKCVSVLDAAREVVRHEVYQRGLEHEEWGVELASDGTVCARIPSGLPQAICRTFECAIRAVLPEGIAVVVSRAAGREAARVEVGQVWRHLHDRFEVDSIHGDSALGRFTGPAGPRHGGVEMSALQGSWTLETPAPKPYVCTKCIGMFPSCDECVAAREAANEQHPAKIALRARQLREQRERAREAPKPAPELPPVGSRWIFDGHVCVVEETHASSGNVTLRYAEGHSGLHRWATVKPHCKRLPEPEEFAVGSRWRTHGGSKLTVVEPERREDGRPIGLRVKFDESVGPTYVNPQRLVERLPDADAPARDAATKLSALKLPAGWLDQVPAPPPIHAKTGHVVTAAPGQTVIAPSEPGQFGVRVIANREEAEAAFGKGSELAGQKPWCARAIAAAEVHRADLVALGEDDKVKPVAAEDPYITKRPPSAPITLDCTLASEWRCGCGATVPPFSPLVATTKAPDTEKRLLCLDCGVRLVKARAHAAADRNATTGMRLRAVAGEDVRAAGDGALVRARRGWR